MISILGNNWFLLWLQLHPIFLICLLSLSGCSVKSTSSMTCVHCSSKNYVRAALSQAFYGSCEPFIDNHSATPDELLFLITSSSNAYSQSIPLVPLNIENLRNLLVFVRSSVCNLLVLHYEIRPTRSQLPPTHLKDDGLAD